MFLIFSALLFQFAFIDTKSLYLNTKLVLFLNAAFTFLSKFLEQIAKRTPRFFRFKIVF